MRLLNGANARFYVVGFADNRTFYKIASDGGLLEAPVSMTMMEMSPGERCEIVVDMADGKSAGLLTLFEDEFDDGEGILGGLLNLFDRSGRDLPPPSLTLIVDKSLRAHTAPLPERLATIIRPQPKEIVRSRDFILTMENGDDGGQPSDHAAMNMAINGAVMDMNVD